MARSDDFAVLVGVQQYPGITVSSLSGPIRDAEYFRQWLVDPNGGDVDPNNVVMLTTKNPTPPVPTQDFPPTRSEFEQALRNIVIQGGQLVRRPNGRLYLYFSGHGFSDFRDKSLHAALYMANAQPAETSNVCGTKFAEWCRRVAAFGEIILVMDCCRDVELSKEVLPPPYSDLHDPQLAKQVRVMEIYAVPYGGKAQERFFTDLQNHHGILTYALVAALYGAPLEKVKAIGVSPVRSGHSLKEFIEGCWPDVAGENGPEAPEFVLPRSGDIAFSKQPPRILPRTVHFAPPIAGTATLRVVDNGNSEAARAELDAIGATAKLSYAGKAASEVHLFDGSQVELHLPPELYELILEEAGAAPRDGTLPMVGDRNVTL